MEDVRALLVRAVLVLAAAVAVEWLLRVAGRRLPLRLTRRFVHAGASHPDPALRQMVGIVLLPVEVALWVAAAWYVSEQLPLLHRARDVAVGAIAMGFTVPLFTTAERGYALRDLLALPLVLALVWGAVGALTRALESRWTRTGMRGGQQTAAMLLRYALTFVGGLIVLQAWGIDVRTLAIAGSVLGVGIGFGLQNLASNFVSGLVISVERPIKPGDYVRVDGVEGSVERIGARCTEIVTSDRVSILVPNSRLLEQPVVSWSHRDPTSRITVKVGVAYGADVALVRRTLLEAARDHPLILADRPPDVDLKSFGASALEFELEVWTREPHRQSQLVSDLNYRIEAAFRRHGIEIPYTQHDVRLRSPEIATLVEALARRHFTADELADARRTLTPPMPDPEPDGSCGAAPGHRCWDDARLGAVVRRLRGPDGVRVVDRRHRLRLHPRCFVGREAVDWLVRHEDVTRDEAVRVGRILIERNVLHHVLDEHTFHDDELFYRFRADD